MAVLTPFFDVVAGVAIWAGRSSLLDRGVFKTANTNFTVRHLLALGFIGYGGWNLWKIERAQDKLKKTLDAESFAARGTWNIYKSQEKVLKAYRESGGNANHYDSLPTTIINKLKSIRNSETLWSDVNRWLGDNPSKNKNPYGGFHSMWDAESFGADGHYLRKSKYDDNGRWDISWEGDSRYRNYAITLKDNPNDIRIVVEYGDGEYSLAIPQPDIIKNFSTMNEVLEYLDNMGDVGRIGQPSIGVFAHRVSTNRSYPTVGDWGAESFNAEESFAAEKVNFLILGSKYIEGVGIVTEGSPYLKNYYGEMDEYHIYDDDAAEEIMSIPVNDPRYPLKEGEMKLIEAMVYGFEHPRINDSWGELNEDGMFWATKTMEELAYYDPNAAESFSSDSRKHGGLKPQLEREPQGYWPGECLKCGLEDKDMDNVFSWSGNCKSCGTNESYGRYNQYIKKDAESFGLE